MRAWRGPRAVISRPCRRKRRMPGLQCFCIAKYLFSIIENALFRKGGNGKTRRKS